MPIWLVRATWTADEAEASEKWAVNADTAHHAVEVVTTHIRFQPHYVEARVCSAEAADESRARDLLPGEARRLPQ